MSDCELCKCLKDHLIFPYVEYRIAATWASIRITDNGIEYRPGEGDKWRVIES